MARLNATAKKLSVRDALLVSILIVAATDNWYQGLRVLESLPRLDRAASILCVLASLMVCARRPSILKQIHLEAWLFCAALVGWAFAAGLSSGDWEKPNRTMGLFVVAILAGAVLLEGSRRQRWFANTIALLGAAAVVMALLGLDVSDSGGFVRSGRLRGFAGGTISIARAGSAAMTVALVRLLTRKRTSLLDIGIVVAAGLATLQSGSRGPTVGAIGAVVAVLFAVRGSASAPSRNRAIQHQKVLLGLLAALLVLVLATSLASQRALAELFTVTDGDTTARVEFWRYSIETGILTPLGVGIGNFSFEGASYPHNIALELFVEGGWIVFGLFAFSVRRSWSNWATQAEHAPELLGLLVYSLGAALVSFDVASNVLFAIVLGAGLRRESMHLAVTSASGHVRGSVTKTLESP